MNCHNCGKTNSSQAKFCGKCGYSLKALLEQETALSQTENAVESNSVETAAPRENKLIHPNEAGFREPSIDPELSKFSPDIQDEKLESSKAVSLDKDKNPQIDPAQNPEVVESLPSATELKSLINSQFNNNYTNQAAIKRYLDAHTEQLKAITFQQSRCTCH